MGKPKGVQRINSGIYPPTGAEPMLDRKFEPFLSYPQLGCRLRCGL